MLVFISLRKLRVFLFIIFFTVALVALAGFFPAAPLMVCIEMVIKINLPCGMLNEQWTRESNKQTKCSRTWRSFLIYYTLSSFSLFLRQMEKMWKKYCLQKCNYNSWTKWRRKFISVVVHSKMWFRQLKQFFPFVCAKKNT